MSKSPEEKKTEALETMDRLLSEYKTVSLATIGPSGAPHVSYAPAALDEARNFYLFLSELSEHTGHIQANPAVSLMVMDDETKSTQVFARNRLTVNGGATFIPRESDQWAHASQVYRARFGKFFDQLTQLRDFHMFQIKPESARLVIGFGAAFDVSTEDWQTLQLLTGK